MTGRATQRLTEKTGREMARNLAPLQSCVRNEWVSATPWELLATFVGRAAASPRRSHGLNDAYQAHEPPSPPPSPKITFRPRTPRTRERYDAARRVFDRRRRRWRRWHLPVRSLPDPDVVLAVPSCLAVTSFGPAYRLDVCSFGSPWHIGPGSHGHLIFIRTTVEEHERGALRLAARLRHAGVNPRQTKRDLPWKRHTRALARTRAHTHTTHAHTHAGRWHCQRRLSP